MNRYWITLSNGARLTAGFDESIMQHLSWPNAVISFVDVEYGGQVMIPVRHIVSAKLIHEDDDGN